MEGTSPTLACLSALLSANELTISRRADMAAMTAEVTVAEEIGPSSSSKGRRSRPKQPAPRRLFTDDEPLSGESVSRDSSRSNGASAVNAVKNAVPTSSSGPRARSSKSLDRPQKEDSDDSSSIDLSTVTSTRRRQRSASANVGATQKITELHAVPTSSDAKARSSKSLDRPRGEDLDDSSSGDFSTAGSTRRRQRPASSKRKKRTKSTKRAVVAKSGDAVEEITKGAATSENQHDEAHLLAAQAEESKAKAAYEEARADRAKLERARSMVQSPSKAAEEAKVEKERQQVEEREAKRRHLAERIAASRAADEAKEAWECSERKRAERVAAQDAADEDKWKSEALRQAELRAARRREQASEVEVRAPLEVRLFRALSRSLSTSSFRSQSAGPQQGRERSSSPGGSLSRGSSFSRQPSFSRAPSFSRQPSFSRAPSFSRSDSFSNNAPPLQRTLSRSNSNLSASSTSSTYSKGGSNRLKTRTLEELALIRVQKEKDRRRSQLLMLTDELKQGTIPE